MDEFFSCRNCIHNPAQSLSIGNGCGFCVFHGSVIWDSSSTTCKYLHRKDLPRFVVDEGLREHAAEFAGYSALVNLFSHERIGLIPYSERFVWDHGTFDPVLHALAQYSKAGRSWVFIQAFTAGVDGRRAIVEASLVRRYMDKCGTWKSSYRLVLGFLQEIKSKPQFDNADLLSAPINGDRVEEKEALWDVVFSRLAALQEYGFHSGLEELMWVTDNVGDALVSQEWSAVSDVLVRKVPEWTGAIIEHARENSVFFPTHVGEAGFEDDGLS